MDDLTKIKGVGKATAEKLTAAGYDSFTRLAAATGAEDLTKLQDAGFATVDIDNWVKAAAALATDASQGDQGGGGDTDPAAPAAPDGPRIRVVASSGKRRRAGISFSNVARIVEMRDLGATAEEQEKALKKLLADPALSVTPVADATEA